MDIPNILPLFAIENLVVFPGVLYPLHIFEPKYKQMMIYLTRLPEEKRYFVLSTIIGDKKDKFGNSLVHDRGVICKLFEYSTLPDGRYNIIADTIAVTKIDEINYITIRTLYRQTNLQIIEENWDIKNPDIYITRILEALDSFQKKYNVEFQKFNSNDIGQLTNMICHLIPLMSADKIKLLAKTPVERIELLISLLHNPFIYVKFKPKPYKIHN